VKQNYVVRLIVVINILFLAVSACGAEEGKILSDQMAKSSYSVGYEFGKNLLTSEVKLDMDVLLAAVREGFEGKKPAMPEEEIRENMKQLRRETVVRMNWRRGLEVEKNKFEGEKFLSDNKAKEGVTTLPSGLQYKVLRVGSGPSPRSSDTVKLKYRGTFVGGKEFDRSHDEPTTVKVDGVIKGWTEALQLMKLGGKWQLFVPSELAYGERQFGRIPPNSTLVFEIELVAIDKGLKSEEAIIPSPHVDDE